MPLSPQQQAVINWTRDGQGNAFVQAVAGSGKTTTLINALKETQGNVAFACFNKDVSIEIEAKVKKLNLGNRIRVGTFHSFGFGAVRRVYPNAKCDAYKKDKATIEFLRNQGSPESLDSFVKKIIGLAKNRAIGLFGQIDDDSKWYDIVDHFDLAYEIEEENGKAEQAIAQGIDMAQKALRYQNSIANELIDFDDMIYLPVITGMKMWENDWILVDEAQDTNPARRALARKMLKANGRAIFVGDGKQAIYGFTGADSDAVQQIIRDFKCIELPLTVTYRCPKSVVREAQKIVPYIEAHESALEGKVNRIEYNDLFANQALTAADAILCRNTKPLVELAYTLIRNKIPCHVEGRDIGQGLLKLAQRWKVRSLDQLRDKLETYRDREMQKLIAKGHEVQADAINDRVETLFVLMQGIHTIQELTQRINDMFEDSKNERKPTLTLSTVHKSKGREWQRVYILGHDKYMPSKFARKDWQIEQEHCLMYVAYTRAMSELIFVPVPEKEKE